MSFMTDTDRVAIIGSGNWGSAIAKLVAQNCQKHEFFETQVNIYVHQEQVEVQVEADEKDGTNGTTDTATTTVTMNLTDVLNERHENVKYLPGVTLPENLVAVDDLAEATRDATLLIFVTPHQFLPRMLPIIRGAADPHCRGIHLIKGIGEF